MILTNFWQYDFGMRHRSSKIVSSSFAGSSSKCSSMKRLRNARDNTCTKATSDVTVEPLHKIVNTEYSVSTPYLATSVLSRWVLRGEENEFWMSFDGFLCFRNEQLSIIVQQLQQRNQNMLKVDIQRSSREGYFNDMQPTRFNASKMSVGARLSSSKIIQ